VRSRAWRVTLTVPEPIAALISIEARENIDSLLDGLEGVPEGDRPGSRADLADTQAIETQLAASGEPVRVVGPADLLTEPIASAITSAVGSLDDLGEPRGQMTIGAGLYQCLAAYATLLTGLRASFPEWAAELGSVDGNADACGDEVVEVDVGRAGIDRNHERIGDARISTSPEVICPPSACGPNGDELVACQ
jgi:hypothetical protein